MSTEITINQDIVEINVTEQVVTIEAPSGAYPLPSMVSSVFGRTGNVVAQEGDYTLTQIGDVTLTSPSNGQVLKYNGTAWVNSSDTDTGLTSVGLSMPSAFSVANSPLTANGTLSVTGAGTTAQYVRGDGSLATLPSLTGFVPYTGATANLDLGTFNLTADVITGATGSFASNGGSNTFAINHSSGSGIALNITKGGSGEGLYINKTSGSGNAATIIGTLNATTLVKSGGTSSQYLMADGSVSTLTNNVTGTGTTNTLPKFTGASTIGNSNVSDSGTLITLGSNTTISSGGLGIGSANVGGGNGNINIAKTITGNTFSTAIWQNGIVQSDVTGGATSYQSDLKTLAASFTLGNYFHYLANQITIGAGSSITNQTGFLANSNMIGATNNYGFRGSIPSGTNRWNLYMDGTANNYMAGSLGIGTAFLTDTILNIAKNLTGASTSYGVRQTGAVQSDAFVSIGYQNQLNTQAASFTLSQYIHYNASQGTIGASSAITTNVGFNVSPTMIGGTNNYGFQGGIPAGTNRWNLYMAGTAANYLAGDTAIGTTTLGTATQLTVGGTETAVSAISRGQLINTNLVASANGDNLVGLDINPTYTEGAFTGVVRFGLRIVPRGNAQLALGATNQAGSIQFARGSDGAFQGSIGYSSGATGADFVIRSGGGSGTLGFDNNAGRVGQFFSTGNFLIQQAGIYADAGFRLDVNGTTRFIGTASSDTAPLGAELAAVTGTGTNWTLAGTNLNVGGYTHTTGSVVALTTALAAVNGTYYQIAYTITGRTTGSITIDYGGTSTSGITATGNTGPLASSTAVLTITPTTDFNGTVVLSIRSIGGSSASSTFSNSFGVTNIEIRAISGLANTFIGNFSGRRNTTGNNNNFLGINAGRENTTGQSNTFIGTDAGYTNTIASNNTFIGHGAGYSNNIGGSNTFIGQLSGLLNTSGSNNLFIGAASGRNNTTASGNTFVGQASGATNTTGGNNSFLGINSGNANSTGAANTFLGAFVGNNNTIGNNNSGLGVNALQLNTNGNQNTAIGQGASQFNTSGSFNIAVGQVALQSNAGGSSNIALGHQAGRYITGGSTANTNTNTSIYIGADTRAAADNQTNQIVIGHNTTGLGSNTTTIGNSSTTTTALYGDLLLGTTTPSTATILTVSGTETASSAIARGGLINTTLVASANGDTLVGLDINPTFTLGAFTGVNQYALRVTGSIFSGFIRSDGYLGKTNLTLSSGGSNNISFATNDTGIERMRLFGSTGNFLIQSGGTFTDAGFRLDVQGTARITQNLTVPNIYSRNIYSDTVAGISILSNGGTRWSQWFESTGNLQIQNGGTFTDIPTARLAVNSTTQGFLPPRMTTTQKLAIATPASGLMVYDTTLNQMSYYNGTIWINF
jgi:hypothetical protein